MTTYFIPVLCVAVLVAVALFAAAQGSRETFTAPSSAEHRNLAWPKLLDAQGVLERAATTQTSRFPSVVMRCFRKGKETTNPWYPTWDIRLARFCFGSCTDDLYASAAVDMDRRLLQEYRHH